ncbi:DUF11 domain-containing protein [Candidatus Parcubacteria bacterium]|nr:DUF11 domain-containing protein [Candidatus Parcubacteria bacterium]
MKKLSTYCLVIALIISVSFGQVCTVFAEETPGETSSGSAPAESTTTETPTSEISSESVPVADPIETTAPEPEESPEPTPTVTVETENTATATNTSTTDALTGTNTASSTATSTIDTGNAYANSNTINVVNVNVTNSDALISILDSFLEDDTYVDLRDIDFTSALSGNTHLHSSTTNNALINNTTIVRSNTGNNNATGTDSLILTGDAYANANIINLANLNLIDSNYLMLIFNNFGSWSGDIVLPTQDFFEQFLRSTTHPNSTSPIISNNNNTADITNTVTTDATTGENNASGDSSIIATGDARAGSNVINDVNQNIIGGSAVALVFRVFGNWSGKILNLPSQLMWNNNPVGVQILGSAPGSSVQNGSINSSNNNTAIIRNNVSVSADTGNNNVQGDTSAILTGDAFAAANVINVANHNVIGRNWMTAIISIFGDWDGNVTFGQPDLWIGTRAESMSGENWPGSEIKYYYTVKNNGDAPASNIVLRHTVDPQTPYIGFTQVTEHVLEVGSLAPGEVKEFEYSGRVLKTIKGVDIPVTSTITVKAQESDTNRDDNTDIISVVATESFPAYLVTRGVPAHFEISKTNNASSTVSASSTVDYTVKIRNHGGIAEDATLVDILTSESGTVINTEEWDLEKVMPDEEITITYTVLFNASTTPGLYTNSAQVRSHYHAFTNSAIATSTVRVGYSPQFIVNPIVEDIEPLEPPAFAKKPFQRIALTSSTGITLSEATTSTTTALSMANIMPTDQIVVDSNNLANVLGALKPYMSYWYLLLLILLVGYAAYRYKKHYSVEL